MKTCSTNAKNEEKIHGELYTSKKWLTQLLTRGLIALGRRSACFLLVHDLPWCFPRHNFHHVVEFELDDPFSSWPVDSTRFRRLFSRRSLLVHPAPNGYCSISLILSASSLPRKSLASRQPSQLSSVRCLLLCLWMATESRSCCSLQIQPCLAQYSCRLHSQYATSRHALRKSFPKQTLVHLLMRCSRSLCMIHLIQSFRGLSTTRDASEHVQ